MIFMKRYLGRSIVFVKTVMHHWIRYALGKDIVTIGSLAVFGPTFVFPPTEQEFSSMRTFTILFAGLAFSFAAAAQPTDRISGEGHPAGTHKMMTVQQEAQMRVDAMTAELPLSTKQVKKLTKFYKKDIQYRRDNFQMKGGAPRPIASNGQNAQRPNHQGGPGMGHGGPGMGQGGHGMGPGMGRPSFSGDSEVDYDTIIKYNAKQEKKLKKILGSNLYSQWRSSHPKEKLDLPKIVIR